MRCTTGIPIVFALTDHVSLLAVGLICLLVLLAI